MGRLLLILAIVALVYLLLKSSRKPQRPADPATEDMVRCAHCGVHLPRGESVESDGQFFCSAAHRDAPRK